MSSWLSKAPNSKAKRRLRWLLEAANIANVRHGTVATSIRRSVSKLSRPVLSASNGQPLANATTQPTFSNPGFLRSDDRTHEILGGRAISKLKAWASKVMKGCSAILRRQVLTASDKRVLRRQRSRLFWLATRGAKLAKSRAFASSHDLQRLVSNASTKSAFQRAEARVAQWLDRDSIEANLAEVSRRLADALPVEMKNVFMTEGSVRLLNRAKLRAAFVYAAFKLWLQRPVTVGTVLAVMASWTLALYTIWFQPPWSEVGYTTGYGAIFMTAAMTARLTVNSKSLYLEHRRPREAARQAAKELNSWIIQTAIARRSLALHEIEEFLSSNQDPHVKELNLKSNAFLMRKKDLRSLQEAIYDTFLKGAPPLLFELGRTFGSSLGRDLLRLEEKPQAILAHLAEVARALGWGIVSAHGDLARGGKLTFTVRESPFCVSESPLQRNTDSCHMLVGMMTGVAEEVYGWPCTSSEEGCVRAGGDSCKIVVAPAMAPVDKQTWNLSVLFPALYPWPK